MRLIKLIIGLAVALAAIGLIASGARPEFFDIFGLAVFTFLFIIGLLMTLRKKLPDWAGFAIFIIGILGLIVDGYIVFMTYIKG